MQGRVGSVGAIGAEHVCFAYVDGQDVLRDISFSIEPREIVGIVGPPAAASRRSCSCCSACGTRPGPDSGRGPRPVVARQGRVARKVTFVPQAAHLIAGTVADNIRFLATA